MENPKMPIIKIHNASSGEEIEREMNADELTQCHLDQQNAEKQLDVEKAMIDAKNDLLAKLGITEEEAKLLLA
jgi:hypothetical protein